MQLQISLMGYNKDQQMVFAKAVGDTDVNDLIGELLEQQPVIEYLHARNTRAGCFICKIKRI